MIARNLPARAATAASRPGAELPRGCCRQCGAGASARRCGGSRARRAVRGGRAGSRSPCSAAAARRRSVARTSRRDRRGELARAIEPAGVEVTVHDRFGTLRVETAEAVVDVATSRRERYAYPGTAEVESATIEEDLRRRDFTINALALPPRASRARRMRASSTSRTGLPISTAVCCGSFIRAAFTTTRRVHSVPRGSLRDST